jgi:hypothetical protein
VYPPVDTEFFQPDGQSSERYAVIASALVPYKRIDVAIEACRLAGVPLKIVGEGPDRDALQRVAGDHASLLGRVSDEDLRELYRRSAVTLLPGEEDFGIVPLEAQACGRPVVALARGGARETVLDGETGLLVDDPSPRAFADAIARTLDRTWRPAVIRAHAEQFGRRRFADQMESLIRA